MVKWLSTLRLLKMIRGLAANSWRWSHQCLCAISLNGVAVAPSLS